LSIDYFNYLYILLKVGEVFSLVSKVQIKQKNEECNFLGQYCQKMSKNQLFNQLEAIFFNPSGFSDAKSFSEVCLNLHVNLKFV